MAKEELVGETDTVSNRIREFVMSSFPLAKEMQLEATDSLLDSGVVDSLGILELVNFVSDEYGIEVGEDELLPENFDSIASLAAFVERTRSSARSSAGEPESTTGNPS